MRGQGIGKLLTDVDRPVNVGLERDGYLGSAYGRKHWREDLIAVEQGADCVFFQKRRTQQHAQFVREMRIIERIKPFNAMFNFCLSAHEIRHQQPGD